MEVKNPAMENINNKSLDDFYELLGEKAVLGKDEEYLKKQISVLENKERNEEETKQLFKYRNELGLSNEGKTKGKMCWDYVKKNNCNHMTNKNLEEGKTLGGKWHPNKEEKEYLKRKKGWN